MHGKFDSKMKSWITRRKNERSYTCNRAGTFEKIEKKSIEEKDGLYTVILVAKYSKEQRTFIITYNDKEEIAGLFINKTDAVEISAASVFLPNYGYSC